MKAEDKAEEDFDFLRIAESIFEKLGDKKWTEKIYKKIESNAEDSFDFRNLADSICKHLKDKELLREFYNKW